MLQFGHCHIDLNIGTLAPNFQYVLLEPHSLCYTCWVQVVYSLAYSTLFPLGDTLLLLSSCRREGVHPELPGVRGLLGVRLLVDIPGLVKHIALPYYPLVPINWAKSWMWPGKAERSGYVDLSSSMSQFSLWWVPFLTINIREGPWVDVSIR